MLIPLVLAKKADMELKDQTVFMNPYSPSTTKDSKEDEEALLPGLGNDDDDDISELLKYCEDKLND